MSSARAAPRDLFFRGLRLPARGRSPSAGTSRGWRSRENPRPALPKKRGAPAAQARETGKAKRAQ